MICDQYLLTSRFVQVLNNDLRSLISSGKELIGNLESNRFDLITTRRVVI